MRLCVYALCVYVGRCILREFKKIFKWFMYMKNILCFGDSLTCGYYNNGNNFYPYAHKLQQLLIYTNIDYIGLNGWTTNDMLTEANNPNCIDAIGKIWKGLKCQLLEKKYDYCIILAGTNDLDELENYNINDLFHLHKIVHDSGCKSIALTIPQVKFESADKRITLHRNNINNMIIKCNSDLINKNLYTYIDISKKLPLLEASYDVRKSLWDNDGIHLNPNGYDLIANLIYENLM